MPLPSGFCPDGGVRYYSLARYALIDALRIAGISAGKRVLLPSYLCRDLLAPLFQLGSIPCWYDLGPELTPAVPPTDWPSADAVLAVNYFGFPQHLEPFEAYTQRTGAVLIEDNAHGYLSRDDTGRLLGCRAGLGIFSLRKSLRIPDGAALWYREPASAEALGAPLPFDGNGLNPAQLTKARLRALPLIGETLFRSTTALARQLRKWRSGSEIPAPDPDSEHLLPAAPAPWHGLPSALANSDTEAETARRRTAYLDCADVAHGAGAHPVFNTLPPHCAPYAFAFRGDEAALSAMRRHAARQGFDLVSWPDLPGIIAADAPAHYRNVFLINFLW